MPEKVVSVCLADSLMAASPLSLEKRDPTKAMLALEMLAGGETWQKVSEATGLNFDQISRVRARHETAIEQRRKELAQDGFEMAEGLRLLIKQKMEMLAENPDALAKTNLRDLVLPYGIAVDKGMQAMGQPTAVVEHRGNKPSLEDAIKAVEEARARLKNVTPDKPVIEVETK